MNEFHKGESSMLSIGSIVYLNEGTSKVMIVNRGPLVTDGEGEQVMYDYTGCLYPEGLDANNVLYFNHENIDKVVFEGYTDEEEERFLELYEELLEKNKSTIKKGVVPGPLQSN